MLPAPGNALNRDFPAVLIHGPTAVVSQWWYRPVATTCKASDGQHALLTPLYIPKEGTKAVEGNRHVAKLISSRLSLCYRFCGALQGFWRQHFPRSAPPGQQNCCRLVPRQDLHFRQWEQREDKLRKITFWVCRLLPSCFFLPSVVLSSHEVWGRAPEKKRSSGFEDCRVWWLTQVEG